MRQTGGEFLIPLNLKILFILLNLFWKDKSRLILFPRCLCVCVSPLSTFEWLNKSLWNLVCIYMAPEPISTAYFISPSHSSVCLYMSPLIVPMQRLGKNSSIVVRQRFSKNVTAATNTYSTTEKLLDVLFSVVSRGVCYQFFPEFFVYLLLFFSSDIQGGSHKFYPILCQTYFYTQRRIQIVWGPFLIVVIRIDLQWRAVV
jgi:hypothetical protein